EQQNAGGPGKPRQSINRPWIERERLVEKHACSFIGLWLFRGIDQRPASGREVVGLGRVGALARDPLALEPGESKIERVGNSPNDLVLPSANLLAVALKALGPKMCAVG